MSTNNWTIKDIRIGNSFHSLGEAPKNAPTPYHSPHLRRTLMGGPGNRSSITGCSCGERCEYIGHAKQACDWYAQHAAIAGGGDAVATVLRQYDEARDVVNYPDHPRTRGKNAVDPSAVLTILRTEA